MIYDLLAPFYDKFNGDINYSDWADFIEKIIEREYGMGDLKPPTAEKMERLRRVAESEGLKAVLGG